MTDMKNNILFDNENNMYCDVHEIAVHLNISPRRVQMLVKRGIIPRGKRGQYELLPALHGYINHLKNMLTRFSCHYAQTVRIQMAHDRKKAAQVQGATDENNDPVKDKRQVFLPGFHED